MNKNESIKTEMETRSRIEAKTNPKIKTINNTELTVKVYQNQRVVTFKDIDAVHKRPDGTARKRFNDNKKHFIEGEDFYTLDQPSEIRTLGIERPQGGTPDKVLLITESGYLMLVKSFTDDLAWDVQRQLVKSYFRNKDGEEGSKSMDSIINDSFTNIPNVINFHGTPVITTTELERHYEKRNMLQMFYSNQKYFKQGVHYFLIGSGKELEFRRKYGLNLVSKLYLWTRKGSLMFTKIVNNEVGWGQYNKLLDILFQNTDVNTVETNNNKECSIEKYNDKNKEEERNSEYQIVENKSRLKLQDNWGKKNAYKIERTCKALGIDVKDFNYLILKKVEEKYDMKYILNEYAKEIGSEPTHFIEIIDHFPELLGIADDVLYEFMLSAIEKLALIKEVVIK